MFGTSILLLQTIKAYRRRKRNRMLVRDFGCYLLLNMDAGLLPDWQAGWTATVTGPDRLAATTKL